MLIPAVAILAIGGLYFTVTKRSRELKTQAVKLIGAVEKYRENNGRLPKNLGEIEFAVTLEGPLYYQRSDSVNYTIWLGAELGESTIYSSAAEQSNY